MVKLPSKELEKGEPSVVQRRWGVQLWAVTSQKHESQINILQIPNTILHPENPK